MTAASSQTFRPGWRAWPRSRGAPAPGRGAVRAAAPPRRSRYGPFRSRDPGPHRTAQRRVPPPRLRPAGRPGTPPGHPSRLLTNALRLAEQLPSMQRAAAGVLGPRDDLKVLDVDACLVDAAPRLDVVDGQAAPDRAAF